MKCHTYIKTHNNAVLDDMVCKMCVSLGIGY